MVKTKTGRPKLVVDWKKFETACSLLATQEEMCGLLNISPDTLSRRVKEKYKVTFAEYIKKSGSLAKVSLRRTQFAMAKNSVAMAIWLGKQYLGQREPEKTTETILPFNPDFTNWSDERLEKYVNGG